MAFSLVRKKKAKRDSVKYKKLLMSIVIVFLFFFSSRIFFLSANNAEDTPLRMPISVANLEVEIAEKTFYTETNILEVNFIINEKITGMPIQLAVKVNEKTDTEEEYRTEILQVNSTYYTVLVYGLSKNWESVSFRFVDKNQTKGTSTFSESEKLYTSFVQSKKEESYTKKSISFYENKYINILISDARKEIKKQNKNIKESYQKQSELKEKVSLLEEDLIYQTETEQSETNQKISSITSQIQSFISDREKAKELISEQENRIEKLQLKKADLKKQEHLND